MPRGEYTGDQQISLTNEQLFGEFLCHDVIMNRWHCAIRIIWVVIDSTLHSVDLIAYNVNSTTWNYYLTIAEIELDQNEKSPLHELNFPHPL